MAVSRSNNTKIDSLDRANKKSFKYIRKRIDCNRNLIDKNKNDINIIRECIKKFEPREKIKQGSKYYELKKGLINPNYESKTVLTDSTWSYVSIYLKSNKDDKALTYWKQAENFYEATKKLDMLSKPLTTYYCFLNATKALLTHKQVRFNLKHGVSGKKTSGQYKLINEVITIFPSGVLSGLCSYLKDNINIQTGKKGEELEFKNILYNLEYIHRAYHLTYKNQPELFIPIRNSKFLYDKARTKGWFEAELEPKLSSNEIMNRLKGYSLDRRYDNKECYTIRRDKIFTWDVKNNKPSSTSFKSFDKYYFNIRKHLRYIYSPNDLWYIKRADLCNLIDKNSMVLTYAGMHRLSELSRYNPDILQKYLEGAESWLLTEFITKSIEQFIDNISSEITGDDFRVTGFRT